MAQLANASATSMNFIGFEELKGQGAPELLFNQVFIEPNLPETAGVGNLAAAGFLPALGACAALAAPRVLVRARGGPGGRHGRGGGGPGSPVGMQVPPARRGLGARLSPRGAAFDARLGGRSLGAGSREPRHRSGC